MSVLILYYKLSSQHIPGDTDENLGKHSDY